MFYESDKWIDGQTFNAMLVRLYTPTRFSDTYKKSKYKFIFYLL